MSSHSHRSPGRVLPGTAPGGTYDSAREQEEDLRIARGAEGRSADAARAARSAFLVAAPRWVQSQADIVLEDGTVMAGGEGWSQEQIDENCRLLEAEMGAARVVWAHPYWRELEGADRVAAQVQLKDLSDEAGAAA